MKCSVFWTENALTSLADSIAYLYLRNPAAAQNAIDRIDERVARLADMPRTGRPYPKANDPNLRQVVVAPYLVVYRVADDDARVDVLMVRHSRRRQPGPDDSE